MSYASFPSKLCLFVGGGDVRVTEFFNLNLRQDEIDFVDVPVQTDVKLFVDPFALSLSSAPWAAEASDRLQSFFQAVLKKIRTGDMVGARRMLEGVSEPDDARLGFSTGAPAGASIGADGAARLAQRLAESRAVQTGNIADIAECELVIPTIGRDKISDITVSVIRQLLVEYTDQQARVHGLPTRRVATGRYWDPEVELWREGYADLPHLEGQRLPRLLLVPKHVVRYELALTSGEYYDDFVVSYLQAEHNRPGDSLSEALRRGGRRVTKKKVKAAYPFSKELVYDFTEQHPEVLDRYRNVKAGLDRPMSNRELDGLQNDERVRNTAGLVRELRGIPVGSAGASEYEKWVHRALTLIFYPALVQGRAQARINNGRKIVDITFDHRATSGTFHRLSTNLGLPALYVPFECKNYSTDPANPELDQLAMRLSDTRSRIGVLVCRSVNDPDLMAARCADVRAQGTGVVLWLTDEDLLDLLETSSDSVVDWDLLDDRARLILDR